MKKDDDRKTIRKTICLDEKTCAKIESLAAKDKRKFSPWVAILLEKIAHNPHIVTGELPCPKS